MLFVITCVHAVFIYMFFKRLFLFKDSKRATSALDNLPEKSSSGSSDKRVERKMFSSSSFVISNNVICEEWRTVSTLPEKIFSIKLNLLLITRTQDGCCAYRARRLRASWTLRVCVLTHRLRIKYCCTCCMRCIWKSVHHGPSAVFQNWCQATC